MLTPQELTALCVPFYVQDVLARLVDNAIKFSKPGRGVVQVSAGSRDSKVAIAVQDQGIGIDPAR